MASAEFKICVRHNVTANRYEAEVGGHLAVADYRRENERIIFTHTFVPPELRGRGIAEQLVRTALDEARRDGRRVVPQCSFVARFIRRNPEFQSLLAGGECGPRADLP
jgi:predicted GNAT family acetyltransferase